MIRAPFHFSLPRLRTVILLFRKKKPLLSTKTREAFSMISDYVKTDDAVNVKASPFHMTCFYNGICTFLKQYMAEKASDSYGVCRVKSVSRKRFCALIASVFFSFATFFKKYLHFKTKDDIITDDIN